MKTYFKSPVGLVVLFCLLGVLTLPTSAAGTLALYLPFDEASDATTFADASGNGFTATCPGDCPTPGVSGKVDGALSFDGTDDYVQVPYDAAFNPAGSFTVAAWAKLDGGSSYRSVITSRDGNQSQGYMIYATDANQWQFWIGTGSGWAMLGNTPVSSEWTHLAGVYDQSTNQMRLYVNGNLNSTLSGISFVANTQYPLRVGAGATEGAADFFFPGSIDEVRVYPSALSQAEIELLAAPGLYVADDAYGVWKDVALTVAAPGVLENDVLIANRALTATLDTPPAHGDLALALDGGFVYTPTLNFTGGDVFTYVAQSGALTDTATVTLSVEINQPPVAGDDTYSARQNQPLTVAAPGVLGNDSDANGDPLTATLDTPPAHGDLALAPDGGFTYTPTLDYLGPDTFVYVASDGMLTDTATVLITVTSALRMHLPFDESAGATTFADLSSYGHDATCSGDSCPTAGFAGPHAGALHFDGAYDYVEVPYAADLNGNSFTVMAWARVTGGAGTYRPVVTSRSGTSGYIIYATAANKWEFWLGHGSGWVYLGDTPVTEGEWLHLAGVYDGDARSAQFYVNGEVVSNQTNVMLASNTQWPLRVGAGPTESAPQYFFDGLIDDVRVYDEPLSSDKIDALVADIYALNDSYTVRESRILTVPAAGVLANDFATGGGALTATLALPPAHGALVLAVDGGFVYTPTLGFSGSDAFTYVAHAGTFSDTATVTLTVEAEFAPVALDDAYTTDELTPLSVAAPGVLGNDSDANGDTITATLTTTPDRGTLALELDGSFVYTPALGFPGEYTFTYAASDGTLTDTATVTLTVAANLAPAAQDDAYTAYQNSPLTVVAPGVLGNDSDPNGHALTATLLTPPTHGTVEVQLDGAFTYTPTLDYLGTDTFTYAASDGVLTDTATVTLTVVPPPCQVDTDNDNVTNYASADASAVQQAVDAAAPGDLIRIAGTCAGVQTRDVWGDLSTQTVVISQNLTLRGGYWADDWTLPPDPSIYTTTLDAQQVGQVIYITGATSVTLEGLRVTGGQDAYGAGLYNAQANLTLRNVIFEDNQADGYGGGVISIEGHLTVIDSTFRNNRTLDYDGGGIHVGYNPLTVTHSAFYSNTAARNGGGIAAEEYSPVTLDGVTFTSNTASNGGGVFVNRYAAFPDGTLDATGCTFQENEAQSNGGGLYAVSSVVTVTHSDFYSNTTVNSEGAGFSMPYSEAVLEDVRFQGNVAESFGGGVYVYEGDLTVTGGVFRQNHSLAESGGGLYASSGSTLTITQSEFYTNTAYRSGGGIYNGGTFTLTHSLLHGNTAYQTGGGVFNARSDATLTEVTFRHNEATLGGGMYNSGWGGVSNPTLTDVVFDRNVASSDGGGMYNYGYQGDSSPTLTRVTFSGNAARDGGGLYNYGESGNSSPTLTDVTFSENTAVTYGGGMVNDGSYGESRPTLTNVTFRNNTVTGAGAYGGAIYFNGGDGGPGGSSALGAIIVNGLFVGNGNQHVAYHGQGVTSAPHFVNCTFSGALSETVYVPGFWSSAPLTFTNSIFWGNGGDLTNNDAAITVTDSIVEEAAYGGSAGNWYADPQFVDAAGGNLRLRYGSPAIDSGNTAALPAGITTDLDGGARVSGAAIDRGAYEFQQDVLALAKFVTPTTDVAYHGTVTYTLVLDNMRTEDETGIILTDTLPTGVDFGGWITSPLGAVRAGNALTWTGALSSSAQLTFVFTATHTGDRGDVLTNTAHFSGSLQQGSAWATFTVVPNRAPVADAGPDQSVNTLTEVTLDGSASTDPDDDLPLRFRWEQLGGLPVELSDSTGVTPTFTAPNDPTVLTFTLTVTDGRGLASAPDTVVITVTNRAPVADAGPDQSVNTLTEITLDGGASTDPDDDHPLRFDWEQLGGPSVELSDPTVVTPTFTAPNDPTVLTFTLTVTDGRGLASAPDTVVITVTNQPPVADAGPDQSVNTLTEITLDGGASTDPDDDHPLRFDWEQLGGPSVELSDPTVVTPTFTAPNDPTVLTFTLTVTDSLGLPSAPDTVVITVANRPPVADAGPDQSVNTLTEITLDGGASTDPDDDHPLHFRWEQLGGLPVELSDPTVVTPTFTAPGDPTVLTFTLTVTDGRGLASAPDTVVITVTNRAPVADAGPDQSVNTLTEITLDGGASTDPDDDHPLRFDWEQLGGPSVELSDPTVVTPTFTAPNDPTVLTFTLTVTDGRGLASAPDTVVITVTNQPPVADAGPDESVNTLTEITLDGGASTDPDDDHPLHFRWEQLGGPSVDLGDSTGVTPTFTAPGDPTVLTFTLTVTDGWGLASAPDTVVITVTNRAPVADAGPDQSVNTLTEITLDGGASTDPDDDHPLRFDWEQLGGPSVELSDPTVVTPTFTAPGDPTVLTFTLTVTDSLGLPSAPDTVVITVANRPPVADAGPDQSVNTLTEITLDGGASTDPDDDHPLHFRWEQLGGLPVELSDPTVVTPTFTAPGDPTVLTFTLTVTDGRGLASAPDTVVITVTNQPPVADAGPDESVNTLTEITLDGGASTDPDDDHPLRFRWEQLGGPSVDLGDSTGVTPTFTAPDDPTVLTFTLTVTDGRGLASAPDTVVITVIAPLQAGILFTPNHDTQAQPGETLTFTHTLTNTGNVTDTYYLEAVNDLGWNVAFSDADWPAGTMHLWLIEIAPQAAHTFAVSVTVPADAADVTAATTVTATSQLDPNVFATATDTTTVTTGVVPPDEFYIFLPLVARNYDG